MTFLSLFILVAVHKPDSEITIYRNHECSLKNALHNLGMCDSLGSCDPPLVLSSSPAPRMIFTGWGCGLVETRYKWPDKILKMKLSVKNKWHYLPISYLLISMNSCLFSAIVLLLFPLSSIILKTKITNTVCARICYKSNLLQTVLLHSSTEIVWLYLVRETSRKKQSSVRNYSIPQHRELLCAF